LPNLTPITGAEGAAFSALAVLPGGAPKKRSDASFLLCGQLNCVRCIYIQNVYYTLCYERFSFRVMMQFMDVTSSVAINAIR
jgi:hypothetical protein